MDRNWPQLIALARTLRKQQTDAEILIWKLLRNRQIAGVKFRRQHPISEYVVDFYSHEHKLAIELDGSQHFNEEIRREDEIRTQRLNQLGIKEL